MPEQRKIGVASSGGKGDLDDRQALALSGAYSGVAALVAFVAGSTEATERMFRSSITTNNGLDLEAFVHASGLRASEHDRVVVYGLPKGGDREEVPSDDRPYDARVGPSLSGVVDQVFHAPIPIGLYQRVVLLALGQDRDRLDRRASAVGNGCMILRVTTSAQPHIKTGWSLSGLLGIRTGLQP